MSKIAHAIETGLFRARWLLMPLYVGLVGVLILLAVRFVQEFIMVVSHFGDKSNQEFILEILALLSVKKCELPQKVPQLLKVLLISFSLVPTIQVT